MPMNKTLAALVSLTVAFLLVAPGLAAFPASPSAISGSEPAPSPEAGSSVYHSFGEMTAELQQTVADHPDIAMLTSIGQSWEGRDIWALKISDNVEVEEEGEPEIYFAGAHHSREWMTIEINLYAIQFLTDNYLSNATVKALVDGRQIWFIPLANPDGRVYDGINDGDDPANHARQPYGWRKNFRDNDDSGSFNEAVDGVDINRNYGWLWGASGQSALPSEDTYGGPYGFSEPETQAIRDFCRQHDFVFAISFHTYSQIILYPWGYTYAPAPDQAVFRSVADEMSARITNTAGSGYPGYTPQQISDLYMVSGGDLDWLYGELGVYAYCIEAYPNINDANVRNDPAVTGTYDLFHPRPDKVPLVCQDNLPAMLLLCDIADNPFQLMDHVTLTPAQDGIIVKGGASGEVGIAVLDDGQRADTFNLVRTTPTGWTTSLTPSSQTLARDASAVSTLSVTVPFGATPGTYRIWVNATSATNSTCRDSSVITVTVPHPEDASASAVMPFAEQATYPRGIYAIEGVVANAGEVALPGFDAECTVFKFGGTSSQTLLVDDAESDTGKWTLVDMDASESASYWHRVTNYRHAGSYGWYAGLSTNTAYSDRTVTALEMTNPISLREASSATLTYWTYYNTETNYDFCVVEGSRDGGATWEYVNRYHGTSTSWTQRTDDLAAFTGASEFKLRFRFTSDEGSTSTGFAFDDLSISATIMGTTTVFGPSPMPVAAGLASGDSRTLEWTCDFAATGAYKVEVETKLGIDDNAANDVRDVVFDVDARRLPDFGGAEAVGNPNTGTSLVVSWNAANDPNAPITYSVWRFDHAPTSIEVNSTAPVGTVQDELQFTDTGLAAFTRYYYVVRAEDRFGQEEWNTAYIFGDTLFELYLQSQASPMPGIQNLSAEALGPAQEYVAAVEAAGEFLLGGAGYATDMLAEPFNISGTWSFDAYARSSSPGVSGSLYAKAFRYNSGAPVLLFTSSYDDEDVSSFQTTHLFSWQHVAPSVTVPAGDRIYVEYWLHATAGKPDDHSITVYDYVGVTQATNDDFAWSRSIASMPAPAPPSDGGTGWTEATDAQYVDVSLDNSAYWSVARPGTANNEVIMLFEQDVAEAGSTVNSLAMTYNGRFTTTSGNAVIYLWQPTTNTWTQVSTTAFALNADTTAAGTLSSGCANYVSGTGVVAWAMYCSVRTALDTDFASLTVDAGSPAGSLTLKYDSTSAPSGIIPPRVPVFGASPTTEQQIPYVAGWNLVSLAVDVPGGALSDVLSDEWGSVAAALAYDTASRRWLTYDRDAPAWVNTLATISPGMGLWVRFDGGDGTLSATGTPLSDTQVSLTAGWNLVGHPSLSAIQAMDLLAGTGYDGLQRYDAAGEYLLVVMPGTEAMCPGSAYWVHVPGDTNYVVP